MSKSKLLFAALAAVGFVIAAAGSAHADASSEIAKCRYDSRSKTVSCCEAIVKKYGKKPMWMRKAGQSCGSAVVCGGGGGKAAKPIGAKPMIKVTKPGCYIPVKEKWPEQKDHPQELHPTSPTHG